MYYRNSIRFVGCADNLVSHEFLTWILAFMVLMFSIDCTARQDKDHVMIINEHNDNELIVNLTTPLCPEYVFCRGYLLINDQLMTLTFSSSPYLPSFSQESSRWPENVSARESSRCQDEYIVRCHITDMHGCAFDTILLATFVLNQGFFQAPS